MEYNDVEYEEYDTAEGWIDRAFESLQVAENESESIQITGNVTICLFSLQQAIEKALKGIIVSIRGNLNDSECTHDIGELIYTVQELGYEDIPLIISNRADEITVWESAPRYQEYHDWSFDDIYDIMDEVDNWLRDLREEIG